MHGIEPKLNMFLGMNSSDGSVMAIFAQFSRYFIVVLYEEYFHSTSDVALNKDV